MRKAVLSASCTRVQSGPDISSKKVGTWFAQTCEATCRTDRSNAYDNHTVKMCLTLRHGIDDA